MFLHSRSHHPRRTRRCSPARSRSGCGSRCCSPISPRRSRKGAARRRRRPCARRAATRAPSAMSIPQDLSDIYRGRQRARSARRRRRAGRGRRHHPRRRRDRRGPRFGQRKRDHRRIRAGHPRGRRRPLGGDRRHDRALRPDQGPDHRRAGLHLHRSHDRARRRRRAAEDAERARAVDPALGPHPDLPDRLRHPVAAGALFGQDAFGHGADRAARLSDPDHDRRPVVGDRHRRHGSSDPLQRDRHLGPRGRGGGRRRYAAARQDRHDHLRQPHGR